MKISCSIAGVIRRDNPKQGIACVAQAGFENIFLDTGILCSGDEIENIGMDNRSKNWKDEGLIANNPEKLMDIFMPIVSNCTYNKAQISAIRAPYMLRDTKRVDLNQQIEKMAIETIKLCHYACCEYVIIRPLFAGIACKDEWDRNKEFYLRVATYAQKYNVMILLENQCKSVNGHLVRGICSDACEAAEWIDRLNNEIGEERFGFCLDVGVCNLCGLEMRDQITALGKRLKAIIIRDNDGNRESAQLPFTSVYNRVSQTDWLGLIRGLRAIGYDGELILNMEDTAEAFSPLLRPQLMKFAKIVADYFKWQIELEQSLKRYDKFVLFGAGNMCRNYMNSYGEQYPPLYTCDNNHNLWGTQFCGLEVKSPEALKDLDKDCVVVICNVYYQEIEQQLREMGIKNIEYFNDEYLDIFCSDRIVR